MNILHTIILLCQTSGCNPQIQLECQKYYLSCYEEKKTFPLPTFAHETLTGDAKIFAVCTKERK